MGRKGKGQGTCIKDPWTKPNGGSFGGRWGWVGWGKMETTVLEQLLKNEKLIYNNTFKKKQ